MNAEMLTQVVEPSPKTKSAPTAEWHAPTITYIELRKTSLSAISFTRFEPGNKI